MNDFIRITNKVIEDRLKGKVNLTSIYYWVIDDIFIISVKYRTTESIEMSFSYSYRELRPHDFLLEMDFTKYIEENIESII